MIGPTREAAFSPTLSLQPDDGKLVLDNPSANIGVDS